MQAFLTSLRSEFYKTRYTLSFWSAILLPLVICALIAAGFYVNSDKLMGMNGMTQWFRFSGAFLSVMGALILPMLVIFQTFSINNMEYRADMWKSLFALPLPKWSVYSSKFIYAVFLNALCLTLFASFIIAAAYLMNFFKPEFKFNQFDMSALLFKLHLKLFLASISIISLQFVFSLLWSDFIKCMGLGFLLTVFGIIVANLGWQYGYTIPYAQPMIAMNAVFKEIRTDSSQTLNFVLMTKEIYVSLAIGLLAFISGYFIIRKRSVN